MGESTVTIGKLKLKLDLCQLLDGYEDIKTRQRKPKGDQFIDIERDDSPVTVNVNVSDRRSKTFNQHGDGDNVAGDKIQNDFQKAIIGFVAQDQAQATVNNLNQTSGASIAELVQLISTMRQTVAQFPPDIRDDMIIDIDDVEVEIQKPEQERNLPKLKKRLVALLKNAIYPNSKSV